MNGRMTVPWPLILIEGPEAAMEPADERPDDPPGHRAG